MSDFDQPQLEIMAEMIRAFRERDEHPDIPDAQEREQWVLRRALKRFYKQGGLERMLVVRTRAPHVLVTLKHDLPYEYAAAGGNVATLFAQFFEAQQLYFAMEAWLAPATKEELASNTFTQPRHHPERAEALVVNSEDAYRVPPLRMFVAPITRDARGKPTVGSWAEPYVGLEGRLAHILPPEAYLAAGAKVPSV